MTFGLLDFFKVGVGVALGAMIFFSYETLIGRPHYKEVIEASILEKAKSDALKAKQDYEDKLRDMANRADAKAAYLKQQTLKVKKDADAKIADLTRQAAGQPGLTQWTEKEIQWLDAH